MYKPLEKIYKTHEHEKKECYEQRVLESEKGSFVPLVFTTSGGCGPLCKTFIQRLASKIAADQEEAVSHVVNHIRTRIRFALLRSTLIALRGVRGPSTKILNMSVSDISFNLIPKKDSYQMP